MDVTPSKRRKLDRDGARASAEEEHQSHGHPLSRSKRTDNDDEAFYAGGLYKSSMFKLQVDELLDEVRPNYEKKMGSVDDSLRKLKSLIEGIPERAALPISEATNLLQKTHKVSVPFPDPKPDRNAAYKLSYSKPSNINVVGSYALKTMVKSSGAPLAVDMVITMPSPIFEKKDYLDYRYFYKRAYYLACIAAGLQDTAQGQFALRFEYLNGNTLHPIIVASLVSDKRYDFEIHIIPAAPSGLFLESRLHPTKNTIRPKDGSDSLAGASPFYNASLRSDCNVEPYLKLLHSSSKQSAGYRDSCILGRLWLQQRGFGSSLVHGGFGHFEWSVLTALLLSGGGPKGHAVLSSGYSSYQMFKAVVQFLSTTNLVAKPLIYQANDFAPLKSDAPMVFDGQRLQNILYKMTPSSYELLRAEAKTSLEMLNDPTFDQFEAAFIIKTDQPLLRYDCIVQLPIPNPGTEQSSCDHLHHTTSFCRQVYAVLKEGLMDRVRLITVTEPALPSWSIKSVKPTTSEGQYMSISLLFDTANVDRLVDHGPSAEEKKKSAKFQKFWGEKAELRRFKDGSILESLVWSPGTAYSILREIVTHLLKLHFGVEVSSSVAFTGEMFEKPLPVTTAASRSFEALMEAYRGFEKNIRDLEGLPLQLRQLSSISPQLRYSSIIPPSFSPLQPLREPADVLIQFEGSGRWPDDIAAIQRTKIAFLIKIGSLLEESDDSITTRIGLENKEYPLQNCAFLDVIYGSGAVFRLRIHNDREQTLLEHQIKEKSNDNRAREDGVAALATYKKVYTQLPLHTQSISTHCTRFPLLSSTIRLVKVWFDRHMLSGHVSEELIELLVMHTFLQAFPWTAPSSAMSGFLRTLLFISRWDWRISPVIVDFTGTMTSKEVSSIKTRLEAWRKIDPGMNRTVVLAASNHDMTGAAFTDRGPSKMVASRLTALARSACKLVKEKGLDLDHRLLFASSTKDYDFIIHLGSKYVSKNKNQLSQQSRFKNLEIQSDSNLELVGYGPVELYISELERIYGNSIVLFHSMMNRSFIAGLWNPQNTPRSFKVNSLYATKPAVDGAAVDQDFVEMDKQAMLAEITRIGGDIVSKVEVNR